MTIVGQTSRHVLALVAVSGDLLSRAELACNSRIPCGAALRPRPACTPAPNLTNASARPFEAHRATRRRFNGTGHHVPRSMPADAIMTLVWAGREGFASRPKARHCSSMPLLSRTLIVKTVSITIQHMVQRCKHGSVTILETLGPARASPAQLSSDSNNHHREVVQRS